MYKSRRAKLRDGAAVILMACTWLGAVRQAEAVRQPEPAGKPAATDASCTLAPVFKNARRLVYSFKSSTTMVAPPATPHAGGEAPAAPAAPANVVYASELTLRLTVLGIDEHGAASMALLFDRVKLVRAEKEVESAADFTREQAEKAEPLAEDAPLAQRLALSLAKSAVLMDVRADGVVASISGLEDAQALAKANGTDGSYLLGPLAANADRRTLTMLFRADAPSGSGTFATRKVGDSWELIDRVPMGAIADLVLTSSLKMESCTPDEARATGAVRTSVEPARGEDGKPSPPEPGQPTIEVTEQTDALSLVWNPKAGALKKRERTSSLSLAARVGAAKRHIQTLRTRSTIELIEMTDP